MPKTIVYLDHNFVSNLAKARAGGIPDAGLQRYYAHLFELLERLVLENRIACPFSTSHELEAEFDKRLERDILVTIGSLARGVEFLDDRQVLSNQMTRALYKYLGQDPPFALWAAALEEDPQAPVVRDPPAVRDRIRVPGRPERARWLKESFVEEVEGLRRRSQMQSRAYDAEVGRQRLSLAHAWFFEAFRIALTDEGGIGALVEAGHALAFYRTYCDVAGVDQTFNLEPEFVGFFASDEFAAAPYVDVFCSLIAGSRVHSPDRQTQESDLYDVSAIATALPYCDILATDAYMKWLIHQVRLDDKYGVDVFSARKADLPLFVSRLQAVPGVEECQSPSWTLRHSAAGLGEASRDP